MTVAGGFGYLSASADGAHLPGVARHRGSKKHYGMYSIGLSDVLRMYHNVSQAGVEWEGVMAG